MKIDRILASSKNYKKGRSEKIQYIVLHYTANNGDTAKNNCNYFENSYRGASAHYFVDENSIFQSVEDSNIAWHCGTNGKYYHSKCRNDNSIGIEMCSKIDSRGEYYIEQETINNALALSKILMEKYNILPQNIVRHYDVTHKICPAPFVKYNQYWVNFKKRLQENSYMKVKREYKYKENIKIVEVISYEDENYIKVRDFASLLEKNIIYNNDTKMTEIE